MTRWSLRELLLLTVIAALLLPYVTAMFSRTVGSPHLRIGETELTQWALTVDPNAKVWNLSSGGSGTENRLEAGFDLQVQAHADVMAEWRRQIRDKAEAEGWKILNDRGANDYFVVDIAQDDARQRIVLYNATVTRIPPDVPTPASGAILRVTCLTYSFTKE